MHQKFRTGKSPVSLKLALKRSTFMTLLYAKNKIIKNNAILASLFHHMADCYRYSGNGERFRAIAYENISRILNNMKEDIDKYMSVNF